MILNARAAPGPLSAPTRFPLIHHRCWYAFSLRPAFPASVSLPLPGSDCYRPSNLSTSSPRDAGLADNAVAVCSPPLTFASPHRPSLVSRGITPASALLGQRGALRLWFSLHGPVDDISPLSAPQGIECKLAIVYLGIRPPYPARDGGHHRPRIRMRVLC